MHQLFECDKPHCYRRILVENAEVERINHKCPYYGGITKVSWGVTKTLVQQMWDKLDDEVNEIMDNKSVNPDYHRARARAFAECLAIFMVPFFTTADDVAKEGLRRYKARKEGDSEYETIGLGARRYETPSDAARRPVGPTTGAPGSQARGRGSRPAAGAPAKVQIRLSEKDQAAIKKAHEGMPAIFTVAVLAKQFGATEAEVRAILNP